MSKINLKRRWAKIFLALSMTAALLIMMPSMIFASPQYVDGNPDCNDVACCDADYQYKFDPWTGDSPDGDYDVGNGCTIHIDNDGDDYGFSWSSTCLVYCVIVKAGNGANVYCYDSGSNGGSGLESPLTNPNDPHSPKAAIRHVTFCFNDSGTTEEGSIKIDKTTTNGLTGTFNFTITKNGDAGFTTINT